MSPITTHVLDTARGKPASGIPVLLERLDREGATGSALLSAAFAEVGRGTTDADGRVRDLMKEGTLTKGTYRITFDTAAYFAKDGSQGFFPVASIVFAIEDLASHYHVPLLLSPFGYSTYRGS